MPAYNRIYLDTNILYSWLFNDEFPAPNKATVFMNSIQNGACVGVISDLTLNELIKVIRARSVFSNQTNPSVWHAKVHSCLQKIYSLSNNVEILANNAFSVDYNQMFGAVSARAYSLIVKYPGKAYSEHHKGLSTVDTFHIVLALNFDCDAIATFDDGFTDVTEIKRLNPREDAI